MRLGRFRRPPRAAAAPYPAPAGDPVAGDPSAYAAGPPYAGDPVTEEIAGPPPVVEEEYGPPPPGPPPPNLWPWLLLLLGLVVGALVAGYFLSRGGNDNNKKSTSTVVVTSAPATSVTVPPLVGLSQAKATRRLNRAGLVPRIVARASKVPAGTVVAEEPTGGNRVARGSVVTLSVSTVAVVKVPSVTGLRSPLAIRRLRTAGLVAQPANVRSAKPAGLVLSQNPAPGESVGRGSLVSLKVSQGPPQTIVPDLTNLPEAKAVKQLQRVGLVASIFQVPAASPRGTVVSQHPLPLYHAPRGSKVRLNVSTGKAPPPSKPATPGTAVVPNLIGFDQQTAEQRLQILRLKIRVRDVASDKPAGTVVGQRPAPGKTVKKGTTVQINISNGPNAKPVKTIPDVVGDDEQTAVNKLTSAGFKVREFPVQTTDPSQNGVVIDEQPAGGTQAPAGSQIAISIGRTSGG